MTVWRAALPMYDLPERRIEVDEELAAVLAALPDGCTVSPEHPATGAEVADLLADPALVLSQTCWGPISKGLTPPLTILAQPDYSPYPGGDGPLYRSAIITTGAGEDVPPPESAGTSIPAKALAGRRLAYNEAASLSGRICLERDTAMDFGAEIETGGHRASLAAVAEGRADVAALDCRTFALLRQFDPQAQSVHVIGWTAARPGLPYVCSPTLPAQMRDAVHGVLIARGAHPPPDATPAI